MCPKPGEGMPPEVLKLVRAMPTTEQILEEVIRTLGYEEKPASFFAENFPAALQAMMDSGLLLLRKRQRQVIRDLLKLSDNLEEADMEKSDAVLWKGITSLSNQSRKRAGVHMEKSVSWILTRCSIPHEEGQKETGRSDLVCPDLATYRARPERCVVLEFKRTLRERWKEVRDEISRAGRNVWLLTLDDYISNDLVEAIAGGNITLYVPPKIYATLQHRPGHLRSLDTVVEDLSHVTGRDRQRRI